MGKNTGYAPYAPIISTRKHRRALVRGEIETTIASGVIGPRSRSACRSFLEQLSKLEAWSPEDTMAVVIRNGQEAWFWVYEPEYAPAGKNVVLKLPWNQRYKKLLVS